MSKLHELNDFLEDDNNVYKVVSHYEKMVDIDNTKMIDNTTFRVHFNDGVDVDISDDRLAELTDSPIETLLPMCIMKRAINDIIKMAIDEIINAQ